MAIIYEVNLKVVHTIASSYLTWLQDHVKQMLEFQGFEAVELYQEQRDNINEPSKEISFVVKYQVASMQDLQHYFQHHAASMRQQGLDLFQDQFSATRRILLPLELK